MKKVYVIILMVMLSMTLVSCSKDQFKSVVSGDFIYSRVGVDNPDKDIAIIGLSEEGKTKENLVFPTMIDGFHVTKIGTNYFLKDSGIITIDKAKRIYFSSELNYMQNGRISYEKNQSATLDVYIGQNEFMSDSVYSSSPSQWTSHNIFVSQKYYGQIDDSYRQKYNFILANVVYYTEEDEVFFVDDADGTVVNVIPPTPYKEGYDFMGWYKDVSYQEVWDFNKDIIPTKQYDVDGNYLYLETKIYAKWNKK